MASLPDSILVVRLGAIGDVTNALVFAEAVRAHAPSTRIGWVVHPLALPLVEGHPAIDRVHLWPRPGALRHLRALRRELRAERYELAVDLQRILKSSLLARLSGAPRVLGYDRGRAKECSWLFTRERIPAGDPRAHMVVHYLDFARHLGVHGATARHRLPVVPEAETWAEEQVSVLGGAPVVLSIGASRPQNRWPAERFGQLARRLREQLDAALVLSGGPGDVEAGHVAAVEAHGAAHNLVGHMDLSQLIALLRRARLVVSADSGPMHLAAAVGRRVVALFGPADPRRTGPWGAGHTVLRVPEWDAASDPLAAAHMDALGVDQVTAAVRAALD